ncbi:MAG: phage protease [Nitrospirota bacterium]
MTELSEKLSFTLPQDLSAGDVPDEVQVLPSGEVAPKGKTKFLVDAEAIQLIIAAFSESATDLVIDYEHQSLSGAEAPAAGWVKELEDRGEDGLWAKVQWTERAQQYLKLREYRYLSPVVLIRKDDGRAVELLGVALTNMPAIDGMAPVVNSAKAIAEADAEETAKYKKMCLSVLKFLGLPEGAGHVELEAKLSRLAEPEGLVPETDYLALKETLKQARVEKMVDEALYSGKISPALLSWAKAYASADPEGFSEFAGKAYASSPVKGREARQAEPINHPQRMVNRLLGIDDGLFHKHVLS